MTLLDPIILFIAYVSKVPVWQVQYRTKLSPIFWQHLPSTWQLLRKHIYDPNIATFYVSGVVAKHWKKNNHVFFNIPFKIWSAESYFFTWSYPSPDREFQSLRNSDTVGLRLDLCPRPYIGLIFVAKCARWPPKLLEEACEWTY